MVVPCSSLVLRLAYPQETPHAHHTLLLYLEAAGKTDQVSGLGVAHVSWTGLGLNGLFHAVVLTPPGSDQEIQLGGGASPHLPTSAAEQAKEQFKVL